LNLPDGTDEVRAMLWIFHILAPGVELNFATSFVNQAGFVQQILDLRTAGCDINVDGVRYLPECVSYL